MSELESTSAIEPSEVAKSSATELKAVTESRRQRAIRKFALAAVGAIPWVGGFIVAFLELQSKDDKINELQSQWLERHATKMDDLQQTISAVATRLEGFGEEVTDRLESPEYLTLVEKAFRTWDSATTDEKRGYVRRLISNAAASSLCTDDLVRLFLTWIETYDETHFKVIRAIYEQPGISRRGIWLSMHPRIPRDDSSEADLFKLLVHDLSLGHVIRQQRATTHDGQFMKKRAGGRSSGTTMKTPFDSADPYELTELGQQFVHYVMDEVAPQIAGQ